MQTSATILAVGDNLIHNAIYDQAFSRTEDDSYNFLPVYEAVAGMIKDADISFINQETMMAKSYPPSSYPYFNSPPDLAYQLDEIGFNVVNLANNHMLDANGISGLEETISLFDTIPSITRIGAFHNIQESRLRILERNGIRFAFLGFAEYTNAYGTYGAPGMVTYTDQREQMSQQITEARALADVVVVSVHFGQEYINVPSGSQKDLAQFLCDNNVDIVIGHHPHVIQPINWLENDHGHRTLVFFSLGNFVSAQRLPLTLLGVVSTVIVSKSSNGTIVINDPTAVPIATYYGYQYDNIKIYRLEDLPPNHGIIHFGYPDFSKQMLEKHLYDTIDTKYIQYH